MDPSKLDTLDEHPSEQELEVHPAVALLIARMESHPTEFYKYAQDSKGRTTALNNGPLVTGYNQTLEHTKSLWNRKEKRLYNIALRNIRLDEAYQRLVKLVLSDKP
jgi:hypothetical protein